MTLPRTRVVITGASGRIGGVLRDGLADSFDLSGVDRTPVSGMPYTIADVRDASALRTAFDGQDVVIDLANEPRGDLPWRDVYENNIAATYACLEAAQTCGVRRVILASSNRITEMYEQDEPYASICRGDYTGLDPSAIRRITPAMPIRPNGPYGIGKALTEAAGRYFSDAFGISVICLRLGTFHGGDRPTSVRQRATLITPADLVRLVRCAIDASHDLRFGIYYGVSNNTWSFWDMSDARDQLGYEPRDNASQ